MDKIKNKVGSICVNFETLDFVLSAFVGRLISNDSKIGAIMTTDLSFSNLVHAFSSLIKYKFSEEPDFITEIDKLIGILNDSEVKRNLVIHSTYVFKNFEKDKNDVVRLRITARQKRGLNVDTHDITEEDLKKINETILFAIQQLKNLYCRLFPEEQIKYA